MSPSEYLLSPLSIIIGYIITVYLDGWSNILRAIFNPLNKSLKIKNKTKNLSLFLLWTIAGFVVGIQFWWSFYISLETIIKSPFNFLMSIAYIMCFYSIAITLFPPDSRQKKIIFANNTTNSNGEKRTGFNIITHVTRIRNTLYVIVFLYLVFTTFYSYEMISNQNDLKILIRFPAILLIIAQLIKIYCFGKNAIDFWDHFTAVCLIITVVLFFLLIKVKMECSC